MEGFVVLVFLINSIGYNCLRVHVLQVLLPQVCQWRGAGKASQARGFSQLGLAPKTVGLGAGDLYIFLTWKCAERVSLPRSELIPQPDMEGDWEEGPGAASFGTVPLHC